MRAMILSAGYGTRLGDVTKEIPKPMLDIQGHPLLEYIITNLRKNGFTNLVINLHFLPDQITNYFHNGRDWNVTITYSLEEHLLGTAGGIKKMSPFLSQEKEFLIHYGDIVTDQNFVEMLNFHREKKALLTMLIHKRKNSNSVVEINENGCVVGFLERPTEAQRAVHDSEWVNSGIYICNREFLDYIPSEKSVDIPKDILPKLIKTGVIFSYPLSSYRCAIDSVERLETVRKAVFENKISLSI